MKWKCMVMLPLKDQNEKSQLWAHIEYCGIHGTYDKPLPEPMMTPTYDAV